MSYNKITFFNHWHLGDIAISKEFIKKIAGKTNIESSYSHPNSPNIHADIPNLPFEPDIFRGISEQITDCEFGNGNLFFNTWYGCESFKWIRQYGITFECLYHRFDDVCKRRLGFSLADISNDPRDFLPVIDFNYFKTDTVDSFFKNNQNKVVLVCNGHAKSGQAVNFDMTSIIQGLAQKYAGIVFILTNVEGGHKVQAHNIFYSEDIIQKGGFDLNENAYIGSKYANVIIGRASGAYSFCYTKENLCERNDLKFISFSDGTASKWCGPNFSQTYPFSTPIIESGHTDYHNVFNLIEQNIL